jgi:uncharacterized membrane protein YeiH
MKSRMSDSPAIIHTVTLPLTIDVGATFLFSITGAWVAIRRHYDAVGLFVIAMASGLGGGLMRDGIFIQSGPPAAMREGVYIIAVLAGCIAGRLFFRHASRLSKPFLILDALGTAAYGVVGASKAYEANLAIPACIFVGVINASASGLIRDVLVREEPLMLKPGQLLVLASLAGVCAFALTGAYFRAPLAVSAATGIMVTFVIRLLSIFFNWKTKAVLQEPPAI